MRWGRLVGIQWLAYNTDRPAREGREARHRGSGYRPHPLPQVADRVVGLAGRLPARGLGPALDRATAVAPDLARLGAEERVAGPAFPAYQRFEEEGERWAGYLHECGERRVGVEHHLAQHWDHAASLRSGEELGAR